MRRLLIYIVLFAASAGLGACVTTGTPLATRDLINAPADDHDFTLIYYVGVDKGDPRRAVILDMETDGMEFIPAVREFEYEILQNVSMEEALYEAEIFFNHEPQIESYAFKAVLSETGRIMGYELRPYYKEALYGESDILKIEYTSKRKRVNIEIGLKPSLKRKSRAY